MDPLLKTALMLSQAKKRKLVKTVQPLPAPRRTTIKPSAPLQDEATAATRPKNWKVLIQGRWPIVYEEEWEERAAIMTYEGGLPKREAEEKAYEDLVLRHKQLKTYEDELLAHERDPLMVLFHDLFDVKLLMMEWKK